MIQNMSWKIDENIFHQKCPKQHSLVTESVSGDACDDISSKTQQKFMFFLPVCHCGTLYSKSVISCARPNTALWRPAARQLQSARSLRLITFGSSASSMLRSRIYSYSGSFFSRSLYLLAEFCSRLIGAVFDSSVTQLSQPS